jgi:hypothetical protein
MPDTFELLSALLNQAEADVDKAQKFVDRAIAEIQASPPEDMKEYKERFLELCDRRAEIARRYLEQSLADERFRIGGKPH